MAEKKNGCKGYAGKISHSGAQKVEAPFAVESPRGKGAVKKGSDLRGGQGK